MDVRAGYKKTEVGVIPEDWNATPFPDVVWFQEGPGLRHWQFKSSGLKVINVTNLQESGCLDLSKTDRHIAWEEFERTYKHFLVDEADVVVASSGNSYCKTAVVRRSDLPLLMNTSVIRFKPKPGIVWAYMLTYLKSKYFKYQIDLMITGGAQPNFGPVHLNKVLIPLPPSKDEQDAIATALSDVDALLTAQDKLIAKKRDIKQAAMQQLLTGKQRLPEFSGEWEVKRLREECELITKGTTPTSLGKDFTSSGINFIKIETLEENGKIIKDKVAFIDAETNNLLKRSQLREKDILVSIAGALGRVAVVEADLLPANTNQALAIVRLKAPGNIDHGFLFYYLNSLAIKKYIEAINVQAAQANLSLVNVGDFTISFPSLPEQSSIAAVLSDMDTELAALEQQRDKTRALKQGMMQELLTGKTRLI